MVIYLLRLTPIFDLIPKISQVFNPPLPPAPAKSRPHRSGPWRPRRQSPGAPSPVQGMDGLLGLG